MKKLLSLILAAMLCLNLAVVSSAAESKASSFEKLSKYMDIVEDRSGWTVSVLNKNVSFQNTFTMESDDFLVIPKGKTLRLNGGAEIGGKIYIENGGKLIFAGGFARIDGTIVSGGTIIRHENTASIWVYGALYVSPKGKLTEKDYGDDPVFFLGDGIARSRSGSIVCFGKTNSKSKDLTANPVAAVLMKRNDIWNELVESEVLTDSIEKYIPDPDQYFRGDYPIEEPRQAISILFDNGSVLYANRPYIKEDGSDYDEILGLNVHFAILALDKVRANDSKE